MPTANFSQLGGRYPNSDYRKAICYFTGNFQGLTAFLRVPGVPLTTSAAESGAKFTKRHHRNSLSFQTQIGADVGAFFMSLIASCLGLRVNPLTYLTALIRWRRQITDKNASDWMPDTFERGVAAAEKNRPSNVLGYRVCMRKKKMQHPLETHSPPHSSPPKTATLGIQ